jgi:hypothetical protein
MTQMDADNKNLRNLRMKEKNPQMTQMDADNKNLRNLRMKW